MCLLVHLGHCLAAPCFLLRALPSRGAATWHLGQYTEAHLHLLHRSAVPFPFAFAKLGAGVRSVH